MPGLFGVSMEVSVICPVFNTSPRILRAAVQSVLDQGGPHEVELVLVDDASTKADTVEALHALAGQDGRIRVVRQDRNAGPSQARATGIASARHDWIGFVDSDDLWPDGKLDQADAVLRERPDTRWISGNYATLLPDGQQRPSLRLTRKHSAVEAGFAFQRLTSPGLTRVLIQDWLPLGASLCRKSLIADAGGFEPRLLYGEDWLLCLRMSILAPMDYCNDETYVLRRQGVSMMRSSGRMSTKLAHSVGMARRDPNLRAVRRELRWFQYATFKDIAMNNALNGAKTKSVLFALRALLVDPRELRELMLFLRLLPRRDAALEAGLRRYSTAEQVVLSRLAGTMDAGPT